MKRKTIARNPLDQLGAAPASRRKGGARKRPVHHAPEVQAQVREVIMRRRPAADTRGGFVRWLDSVLDRLTG